MLKPRYDRRKDPRLTLALARERASSGQSPELLQSIEDCKRFGAFVRQAWHAIEPGTEYIHNWHVDLIAEYLEAVTRGEILRLLINMPPRYMKSIMVSIMWPCWEWTQRPELRDMFATYAGSLSKDHSNARRAIINSPWYQERWGSRVIVDKDDVLTFSNSRRGVFEATSFTGTATGKGGNRVVADDPHNPKQAASDLERTKTLKLFRNTLSNRLNNKKEDAIVVVMQRLHEKDVSDLCIQLGYVHLCLPIYESERKTIVFPSGRIFVREAGELLWPEREGPEEIKSIREVMGTYDFAGQYLQVPAPPGGGIFRDFQILKGVPAGTSWVRYWDKAATHGGGARTAGAKVGRTPDGKYVIADMVKGQWSAGEREAIISETAAMDGHNVPIWQEQEPGSGGKESAENTAINLAGYIVHSERVTGDKVTRARPLAAQTEIHNVYLVEGPWNGDFIDECRLFPNGQYKDQVDAAAGGFNKVALHPRPAKAVAVPKQALPSIPTTLGGGIPGGI